MSDFIPFRTFTDAESAADTVAALTAAGVDFQLEDTRNVPRSPLMVDFAQPEVRVVVRRTQLQQANTVLQQEAMDTGPMPADHYLHQFTDDELLNIMSQPHEWNEHDYVWAQRLLLERGHSLRPAEVQALRYSHLEQLAEPKALPRSWQIIGWLAVALGAPLGIGIGLNICWARTTLPDGRMVPTYSAASRRQGIWMVGVGAVVLALSLLWYRYQ